MKKTVLVLMATYNGEKYLNDQLKSIFNQTDVLVKVLVRDDGSTDNTISILKDWSKTNNLEWYTGEHLNVQFGFYDLMVHAKNYNYNYFAFSDQDDIWDSDKLYIALQHLQEADNLKPSLYYCGQKLVDENLNYLDTHYLNTKRNLKTKFIFSDIAGCTAVFNKDLLLKVITYKPSYMMMHDTWILKVCLSLGGEVFVDKNPHMNYRQHGNNTVGLSNALSSKIKRANTYIFDYDLKTQMSELLAGYEKFIVPEYLEVINKIINAKKNKKYFFDKKKFDFYDKGLNLTFRIKVLLNKL